MNGYDNWNLAKRLKKKSKYRREALELRKERLRLHCVCDDGRRQRLFLLSVLTGRFQKALFCEEEIVFRVHRRTRDSINLR